MQGRYKVVTLCGSTRFKAEYERVQKELTLKGYIVISVGLFGHHGDDEVWNEGTKEMLDDMHFSKIDMADEIFVINVDGYVGDSTSREIAYAKYCGKKINSLEPIDLSKYTSEPLRVMVSKPIADNVNSTAFDVGCRVDKIVESTIEEYNKILEAHPDM